MRKKNVLDKKPLSLDKTTVREITSSQVTIVIGARYAATSSGYLCC
jgi:hypothetical protein